MSIEQKLLSYKKIPKSEESLSGIEAAKNLEIMYDLLGPELGSLMVESNVILTVAGMKGMTNVPWVKLDKKSIEKIKQSEAGLRSLGVNILYNKELEGLDEDPAVTQIAIENVGAIGRKAGSLNIPGVPRYDRNTGKEGLIDWMKNIDRFIEEAKSRGDLSDKIDTDVLLQGIFLGYPDQAILDFERCLREGDIHNDLEEADILSAVPSAEEYYGAVPEFDYYPEHRDDPDIVSYITRARKILGEFYGSDWFKNIIKDDGFIKARKHYEETSEKYFLEKISPSVSE